jgi:hypothetical protein
VRRHRGPLQFGRSFGWGKRGRICGGEGQIFGDDWLAGEEGKRTLLVGEVTAVIQWGIFSAWSETQAARTLVSELRTRVMCVCGETMDVL